MENRELLRQYVERQAQEAFRQLVDRHLPMVLSTARRMVLDPHLAEDVAQSAFLTLAQKAASIHPPQVVGGWLYNTTRHLAFHAVRDEHRRRAREQTALAMQVIDLAPDDPRLAERLEPAMAELDADDRDALVLRYLENRPLRDVGAELGLSEDAARMKINRALERLRQRFDRQGVGISTVLLASALVGSTTAVPAGMAASVTTAVLAATTIPGATAVATQALAMTTLQKSLIAAALVAAGVTTTLFVQAPQQSRLRAENATLRQQQTAQAEQFQAEMDRLSNRLQQARAGGAPPSTNESAREVLKLRGDVARLRQEKADSALRPSALSAVIATPEMRQALRLQQKAGMAVIYKNFAREMGFSRDQTEAFNAVLADHIVEDLDHLGTILRDGRTGGDLEHALASREAILREKVRASLGEEGFSRYQDYSRNLVSMFTAEEFMEMLSGDDTKRAAQGQALRRLMESETQRVLADAGLPPDYQTLPVLNLRNIASPEEAERNLQLLESLYERVHARAGAFLSAEELLKFAEFRQAAVVGNRASLTMNRQILAPPSR